MNRLSLYSRVVTALGAVAIVVAGCADSRMAANNAASDQGEQPYKAGYGLTSDGPTTDLYTELFGSRKTAAATATAAPATATAAPPPMQPVTASTAPQPTQPAPAPASARQGQIKTATTATRQVQPAPAPVEAVQQPAAPQPAPEPDVPVAYGITASGPTTDLYTELFGPRRRDGQ